MELHLTSDRQLVDLGGAIVGWRITLEARPASESAARERCRVVTTRAAPCWKRGIAFAIDTAVVWLLLVVVRLGLGLLAITGPYDPGRAALYVAAGLVVMGLFHIGWWHLAGATPGQRLLRLAVLRLDGGRVGLIRAVIRFATLAVIVGLTLTAVSTLAGLLRPFMPTTRLRTEFAVPLAWAVESLATLGVPLLLAGDSFAPVLLAAFPFLYLVGLATELWLARGPAEWAAVVGLALATVVLLAAPFWTAFFRSDRRLAHDLAAGTTVVETRGVGRGDPPGQEGAA